MDERAFLQLLLEDAPADAFEEPLRAARARDARSEEIERLQDAAVLALQLRSILHERRRREGELAALSETAGDLISMRDLQRVLQAIVRRARQLLHADTAYLTLIDHERGDTCMQVTEGTVGEAFRRLRLPFGVGLGGLVAQTARASFTSNYLDDPRYDHTAEIDDAVAGEQIVAILGVPLLVGDRVLGVLFASERRERHFTPDDVNLLTSLGAHAAVAIENARLFQEARHAVAELNVANAVARAHSAAVERAAAAHDRLTDVVLHGGDVSDIAAVLADLLHGEVSVLGEDGRVLAQVGVPAAQAEQVAAALAPLDGHARTVRVGDEPAAWVTPVSAGGERLGALVLGGVADLGGVDLRTFERSAQVTALLLLTQRSIAEAENRTRGEFFEDLLTHAHRHADRLRRRARLLGVDLDAQQLVLVASAPERAALLRAARALVVDSGGLVAERGGAVVVLLPGDSPARAAALARRRLGSAATTGVAGPAASPVAIAAAYRDADRCRRVLLALAREGDTATADDLGVYALLFSQAGRDELDAFVSRVLGPVLVYDEQHGTALAHTLAAYFAANANVTRAAASLHVHVNTLYQRLGRVTQLLDRDWQQPTAALDLHLALTLRRLRENLQPEQSAATAV